MIELDQNAKQQTIRTLVAGLLAVLASYGWNSSQSMWIVLAAMLFVQIRVGGVVIKQLVAQVILGLLVTILVFLSYYFTQSAWVLAIVLSLMAFVSVYWSFKREELFLPSYLISLLIIVSAGIPVNLQEAMMRSKCVLGGVVIAIIATAVLWPASLRRESNYALAKCLQICKQLVNIIFTIYLRRDYAEQHLIYEKEIYQLSQQFFYYKKDLKGQHISVDVIFELILSLGVLRYRIKDYSTFEIIQDELQVLLQTLTQKLNKMPAPPNNFLIKSIDRLEDLYRGTLQVAAKEPLVFLFFIYNLKALALYFDTEYSYDTQ